MNEKFKSGFVAIIGNPSVGKSTLINSIIGEKIAITSNKPQTTRNAIKGILTNDDYQIIFLDTPGVNKTHTRLAKVMDKSINDSIAGTDVVIAMVDLTRRSNTDLFLGKLNKVKCPVILLLNKVDELKDKQDILTIISEYNELYKFDEIIPVSAYDKNDVKKVKSFDFLAIVFYPHNINISNECNGFISCCFCCVNCVIHTWFCFVNFFNFNLVFRKVSAIIISDFNFI